MDRLREDFLRFSKLHSWYKHIPLKGTTFYAYLDEGQQARNGINAEVEDWHGPHWHFSTSPPESGTSYKVRFGPFLRGCENYGVRGFQIIVMMAGSEAFDAWIAAAYPDLAGTDWMSLGFQDPRVLQLFESEKEVYWNRLKAAVFGNVEKDGVSSGLRIP